MAINTFKPSLWEQALLEKFKGICVADLITTAPSSVEGTKAIFNSIALSTGVQDYAGTVEYEDIDSASKELIYNKKKYVAYKIDDVDAAQAVADVMMPMARDMAYDLKRVIDAAVFNAVVSDSGVAKLDRAGSSVTPSIYECIVDLGTALDENDVPEQDRFIICRPETVNELAKDENVINNTLVLPNGVVQGMQVNGMQVIKTTACPENKIIVMHKSAVGYGKQIDKMEALRLEGSFSDAIRLLLVFGVSVLRPAAAAVFTLSK